MCFKTIVIRYYVLLYDTFLKESSIYEKYSRIFFFNYSNNEKFSVQILTDTNSLPTDVMNGCILKLCKNHFSTETYLSNATQ
jgi:protein involved in sex pheromone biosynthesis